MLAGAHTNRTPYDFFVKSFFLVQCAKSDLLFQVFFFPIKDREKSSHQKGFLSPTATLIMLSAGAEGMRQAEAI